MGIFDPKVDTTIAYEKPVSPGPSTGLVLGETLGRIGESVARAITKDSDGGVSASRKADSVAMVTFQDTLMKAEAARSQGEEGKAERLERTALLNAQRMGLNYNTDLQATYTAITGRDGENLLYSENEILVSKIKKTPEFQSAVTATYASGEEMTLQEREQAALGIVARQEGQKQILMNDSIKWTEGKRDTFYSVVNDFETSALGTLNQLASQQGFVGQDQLRTSRIMWEQTKSALYQMRPQGVSDDQWGQFENRVSRVDAQFKVLEDMSSESGLDALISTEILGAIQGREDWTPGMKMVATTVLNDAMALNAIKSSELKGIADALINEDFRPSTGLQETVDETGQTTTTTIPKEVRDSMKGEDAEKSFTRAKSIGKLLTGTNQDKVTTDPVYRTGFLKAATLGFAAMDKIGKENRRFVTAEGINQVFSGEIVEGLRRVGQVDPVRAEATATIAVEALDNQYAIASQQLSNTLQGTVLRVDKEGSIVLNREALLERTTPEMFNKIESAAQEYYGGDVLALLQDKGRRVPPSVELEMTAMGQRYTQEPGIELGGDVLSGIQSFEVIRGQLRSVKAIGAKRNEFISLTDSFSEKVQKATGGSEVDAIANEAVAISSVRGYDLIQGDTEFLGKVQEVSDYLGIPSATQLLQAMSFETVGTFNPSIKNPGSTATGLIQFLEKTANNLGTTTADLANMNRVEQMEYVKRYLEPFKGRLNNVGDVYMAIHWPAGVGKDSSYVMYERGTDAYAANSGLDTNKDGTVTRGEAVAQVLRSNKGGTVAAGVPQVTTEELPPAPVQQEVPTGDGGGVGIDVMTTAPTQPTSPEMGPEVMTTAPEQPNQRLTEQVSEQQKAKVNALLKRFGVDPESVPKFNSMEAAQKAIDEGTLKEGDLYEVNGEIEVVEGA